MCRCVVSELRTQTKTAGESVSQSHIHVPLPPLRILLERRRLLHVMDCKAFTYTEKSLYRTAVGDRRVYTQKLLRTEAFSKLYTEELLRTEDFTQRSLYTEELLHRRVYPQKLFAERSHDTEKSLLYTETPLHTEAFTHRSLYPHTRFYSQKFLHGEVFAERSTESFCAQKLLHRDSGKSLHRRAFTHRLVSTQKLLHTGACTQRSFSTEKPFHIFDTEELLHTEAFTQRSLYTGTLLHTHTDAFTHKSLYTEKLLPWFRARGLHRRFQNRNFRPVCDVRLSFRAKWLHLILHTCHFTPIFRHFPMTL